MGNKLKFDYYYGVEAEQFSFYRIPRLLIKDERFKELSSDAKLLYGLMLDRMALSIKNGWFDEENRAFIYYTLENIMEDLGCGREKSVKILAELDYKKGIGLIEKKRQGLGKPDIIYVKNFTSAQENEELNVPSEDVQFPEVRKTDFKESEKPTSDGQVIELPEVRKADFKEFEKPTSEEIGIELPEVRKTDFQKSEKPTPEGRTIELPEVRKTDFQKFEKPTSRSSEIEFAEVREADANYNDFNYTDFTDTQSIYQSPELSINQSISEEREQSDEMDETARYMQLIKENIEYEHLMTYAKCGDKPLIEELFQVICEVVCIKRKSVKIGGEDYPYELVKAKFLKLNASHIEYIIFCMQRTTTKIANIKAYMITALYNAPNTINHFYQQEVQHDMYGGSWHEKGIV